MEIKSCISKDGNEAATLVMANGAEVILSASFKGQSWEESYELCMIAYDAIMASKGFIEEMDQPEASFVVCGYAAAHTQYPVSVDKVNDLVLDTENGEQILTVPMTLQEAWDYIHGY